MARSQTIVLARAVEVTDLSVLGTALTPCFVARNFGFIYAFPYTRPGPATREVEVRGTCHELYRWDQFFTTDWRDHVPFNIFIHPDTIELWEKWTFTDGVVENIVKARAGSAFQPQFNCRDRQILCQAGISSQGLSLGQRGTQTVTFQYLEEDALFPTDHLDHASGSYADSDGNVLEASIVREAAQQQASVVWALSGPFRPTVKVHVVTPDLKPFDDLKYRIVVGRHTVKDFGASDAAKNALASPYVIEASGQYEADHDFGMVANTGALIASTATVNYTRDLEAILPRVQVQVNQDGYEEEAVSAPSANAWEFAVGAVAAGEPGLKRPVQVFPRFHAAAGVRGFNWRSLALPNQVALPARSWSSLGPDGSVSGQVLTAGGGGCVFRWTLAPETQIMPYRWLRLTLSASVAVSASLYLYQAAASGIKRYNIDLQEGTHQYWVDLCDPDEVGGVSASSLGEIDDTDISEAGTAAYGGRFAGINRLNNFRIDFMSAVVTVVAIDFVRRSLAELVWGLQGCIGHLDYRDAFRKLGVLPTGWPYANNLSGQQLQVQALQGGAWPPGWQPAPGFDTDTPMVVDEAGNLLSSLQELTSAPKVFRGERYVTSAQGNLLHAYDGIGQTKMFGPGFVAEFVIVVGGVASATAVPPGEEPMEVHMPDPGAPAAFATGGDWEYQTQVSGWEKKGIHKTWPATVDAPTEKVEHYDPDHSPLVKDLKRFDTAYPATTRNHLIHLYVGASAAAVGGVHSCGDDHGNSWVAYVRDNKVWVWRYNDWTWDEHFVVSDTGGFDHPKISSGVDENPWVVFDDGNDFYITISPDQGQTWLEPMALGPGTNPVPADDRRDGYQYVAVWDDPWWKAYRKRSSEIDFAFAGNITDQIGEGSTGLHVVTDSKWPLHFVGSDSSPQPRRWRSPDQGETWEEI